MKKIIFSMLGIFLICGALVISSPAVADWPTGLQLAQDRSELPQGPFVEDVVFNVLQWLLLVFTFIAVIAFVVTGLMYITAGGDSQAAERAKRGVVYSIIGVAVGLSGYIVISQVVEFLT